jgi:alpha-glucosidase (family GH31 glycosyl hydrolase)
VVWAGDNRRDWVGLEDALDHMFRSAEAGYVVVGSDLGGYLDRDDLDLGQVIPANRNNFLRWTAASALSPFMQLHGRANLTPWTFPGDTTPEDTADIYKFWAILHTELVPFFYGLSEEGFKTFTSILQPVGAPETWSGDYRYTLGEHLLVAPILDDTGVRDVTFPDGTWFDLWTGQAYAGTQTFDISTDFKKALVFAAQGSIVPTRIDSATTGLGGQDLAGLLTLLVVPGTGSFKLHEDDTPADITMSRTAARTQIDLPNRPQPTWLRILASDVVVRLNGQVMQPATDRAVAGPNEYVVDGPFVWVQVGAGQAHTLELVDIAR